jgi:hypothetical protein
MNKYSLKSHSVEGPITYDFTLHFEGSVTIRRDSRSVLQRPWVVGLIQNQNTMALQTLNNHCFILFVTMDEDPHMNGNSLRQHSVEGPVTYDFTLHFEAP